MKEKNYSPAGKRALVLMQCLCTAAVVLCLLLIERRLDGTFDIAQLGRSFEETAVFLSDTEDTIRRKTDCERNIVLFQSGGETDLNKEIDIRQYVMGVDDEANRNENLTYLLSDLINFYPSLENLRQVVRTAEESGEGQPSSRESWEALSGKAEEAELILPLSGNTLASTAGASATPYETLLEYYSVLEKACEDIHIRYRSYVEDYENPEGSASPDAPSNISYYLEDLQTKRTYTNMGVNSVAAARVAVEEDHELTMLFDGVRTKDIMVANSEYTLNERAASWFIDSVFLGSNERVVIAVNRDYPAGDELREDYLAYQKREPQILCALLFAVLLAAGTILCLTGSVIMTGRKNRTELIPLTGYDLIPTEIAAGIGIITALIWFYLCRWLIRRPGSIRVQALFKALFWAGLYWIGLMMLLSMVRRIRWKSLWTNSVFYTVVRVGAQMIEARVTSARMLIVFAVYILLNFLFLRFFGTIGIVITIVLDLALVLYLIADQLGKLSVREGLRELSKGRLDYKIDTSSLTGDSLEMAEAVNEMGDGLKEAVDSIVRSERLKTELITNVSHDLKTPLTSIINYVDLLKREDLQNEKAREYVDILDRKSQRLKSLITDLIEASRISSGNVELNMTSLDLRSMVQMAVGEYADRFEELDLTPVTDEEEQGRKLMISADPSQLFRVFDNLLSNIAKYAKPGTEVRISLKTEDGMASCSFENESSEELTKSGVELEERFVRGDSSRSSEGSGLGLSIASSLTRMMGGEFTLSAQDHLFCARVRFPLI